MTEALFDEWRVYRKLLDNDYMHHARFFARLEAEAARRFDGPIDILDLGCGDVSPLLPMLGNLQVRHYHGVDESETSLLMAEENLAALGIERSLRQGDFLQELPEMQGAFDIILASYSLHHLEKPQAKQQVLEQMRRLLKPGGTVAVIDVFLVVEEDRESYLRSWESLVRGNWHELDEAELEDLFDHARRCDFPESLAGYEKLARGAGFSSARCVEQDDTGKYKMLFLETDETGSHAGCAFPA